MQQRSLLDNNFLYKKSGLKKSTLLFCNLTSTTILKVRNFLRPVVDTRLYKLKLSSKNGGKARIESEKKVKKRITLNSIRQTTVSITVGITVSIAVNVIVTVNIIVTVTLTFIVPASVTVRKLYIFMNS